MKLSNNFYAMSKDRSTFQSPVSAPCFRKEFSTKQIETATVTVCGLGFYELFLNGKRITAEYERYFKGGKIVRQRDIDEN